MHEMKESFTLLQGLTLTYSLKVKASTRSSHLLRFTTLSQMGFRKHRFSIFVLFNFSWACILSVCMWVLPGNHLTTVSQVTEIFKMLFVCLSSCVFVCLPACCCCWRHQQESSLTLLGGNITIKLVQIAHVFTANEVYVLKMTLF